MLDSETIAPIEICLPVAAPFQGSGEVYGTELAGGPAAVTLHPGPYAEIGPAYHTVSGWVQDHGHELDGGPREVYLNTPDQVSEADLQTEVVADQVRPSESRRKSSCRWRRFSATASCGGHVGDAGQGQDAVRSAGGQEADDSWRVCAATTLSSARPWTSSSGRVPARPTSATSEVRS